jgi:hypothetical protein
MTNSIYSFDDIIRVTFFFTSMDLILTKISKILTKNNIGITLSFPS